MAEILRVKAGTTLPRPRTTLMYRRTGTPVDLTGATVTFRMRPKGTTSWAVSLACTVLDATAGSVEVGNGWDGSQAVVNAANYDQQWYVTWSATGESGGFPSRGFNTIIVEA